MAQKAECCRPIANSEGIQDWKHLKALEKAESKGKITEAELAKAELTTIGISSHNWRLRMLRAEYASGRKH